MYHMQSGIKEQTAQIMSGSVDARILPRHHSLTQSLIIITSILSRDFLRNQEMYLTFLSALYNEAIIILDVVEFIRMHNVGHARMHQYTHLHVHVCMNAFAF